MQIKSYLATIEQTEQLGRDLAGVLEAPLMIGLKGNIGMGKTCMVRAMLRQLGIQSAIKSPTFNLLESYQIERLTIHHFDLYRLSALHDLDDLGFRDYLEDESIVLMEWPENAPILHRYLDITIELSMHRLGRDVILTGYSPLGIKLIANLLGITCLKFS